MKQLELRYYKREEISQIFVIEPNDHNFKRKIETKLIAWGYSYTYSKKSFTITAVPESAAARLQEIMCREYNIDLSRQDNIKPFANFIYLLANDIDGFASMPWRARSQYLKQWNNIEISDRTLQSWCKLFVDKNEIGKIKTEKTYWMTTCISGEKIQEELIQGKDSPEWKAYWKTFFELKKTTETKQLGLAVYQKMGYCVYSCPAFLFCAWSCKEIIELSTEIVENGFEEIEERITIERVAI